MLWGLPMIESFVMIQRSMAAAQTVPTRGDVEANLQQHLQLIEKAASAGVGLVVFPELSLTGYELELGPALAFEREDPRLRPLIQAAIAHTMTLVVGAPVCLGDKLYIGAFIVGPTGELSIYTKHHLGAFRPEDHPDGMVPPPETNFFAAGELAPLVDWNGRKLAISICADSGYASHPAAAAERGADTYLSCQFAIDAHMAFKMSRLKEAARRHGLVTVFANFGGNTGGLRAAGGSCVRRKDGAVVVRLPEAGCGLAVARECEGAWEGEVVC